MAPHHMLIALAGPEVVVIIASSSPAETERRAAALAASAREALEGEGGWSVLVGVGDSRPSTAELSDSYRQGRDAVRVGRALGRDGFVRWSELGAYRTIAELVAAAPLGAGIPASLRRLLASEEAKTLTRTLECYLDLGGDARAAAEALYLHRSSLYGRLHRIEEVAGVDMRSGEVRLELHLGLRLWHLAGGGFPPSD
jgi:sugar diacid utilization regulator